MRRLIASTFRSLKSLRVGHTLPRGRLGRFASMNLTGMSGAGLQMFSHGAMTALFFACVGMVYDQAHTRDIPSLSGFARKMPFVAIAFIFGGLVSMGMPGLSGFIAEFPILSGVWRGAIGKPQTPPVWHFPNLKHDPLLAILAAPWILLIAASVPCDLETVGS